MNVPEAHDPSINQMIRELQPGIVINDRGMDAGDFGTPERDYQAVDGLHVYKRPTEACDSVGAQSWGFRREEHYRSPAYLIWRMASNFARGVLRLQFEGGFPEYVLAATADFQG